MQHRSIIPVLHDKHFVCTMFAFSRLAARTRQVIGVNHRCKLSLLFQSPAKHCALQLKTCLSTSPALHNRISSALLDNDRLQVQWQNGKKSEFHNVWLRDHCSCDKCFNHTTNQREYDMLELPLDIQPKKVDLKGDELQLTWPDDHVTVYSADWLMDHEYKSGSPLKEVEWVEPFLWNKQQIASVDLPKFTLQSVLDNDKECCKLSLAIEKYGFAFVHEVPTEMKATEKLVNRIAGFIRVTNYGGLWEFSNEVLDHLDTAYTAVRLEAHNDNAYFADPSGLQMLHCTFHDGTGGESLLVDGFNVAELLKQKDFEAFQFLSTQKIPFHFKDNSLHIKADGHVIELDPYRNNVKQIRFNMYDRDILDCLAPEDVPKFYRAFKAMAAIVRDPENEFWFKLTPGTCLVMANWRVMHGRSAFTGVRNMQGCYANKDDFQGQFRSKYDIYKNELD